MEEPMTNKETAEEAKPVHKWRHFLLQPGIERKQGMDKKTRKRTSGIS